MRPKGFAELLVVFAIVLVSLVFVGLYTYQNSKKENETRLTDQTEINDGKRQLNPDEDNIVTINNTNWESNKWQSFTFSYPKGFTLTDGEFSGKYFYLDYEVPQTRNNIRIFGVSENWGDKTIEDVVASRKVGDEQGFPGYTLEEDGYLTPLVYYKLYTFTLDPTKYRTYRITKKYGEDFRVLTVNSEINTWNSNAEVFENIIKSIKY